MLDKNTINFRQNILSMKIRITDFAKRHFDKSSAGTKILSHTVEQVEDYINSVFESLNKGLHVGSHIDEGYAPFCKLLFVPNFTDARTGTAKITNENYQWLRSGYYARTEQELPVLTRALHLPVPAEIAKYLVFILYTREQLEKENLAKVQQEFDKYEITNGKILSESEKEGISKLSAFQFDLAKFPLAEYGVVSILGQMHDSEEPMAPITFFRNHLGMEFGGSGAKIDVEKYMESVNFWKEHALIK